MLDASAVLAVYFDEPGAEVVRPILVGSLLSSVNYSEVIGKALDKGDAYVVALRKLATMGLAVIAHDMVLARRTGELRPLTRRLGLSVGDRACLALAEREHLPAFTADGAWAGLDLDIEIRVIR